MSRYACTVLFVLMVATACESSPYVITETDPFEEGFRKGGRQYADTLAHWVRRVLQVPTAASPLLFEYSDDPGNTAASCEQAGGGDALCRMLEAQAGLRHKNLGLYHVRLLDMQVLAAEPGQSNALWSRDILSNVSAVGFHPHRVSSTALTGTLSMILWIEVLGSHPRISP